MLSFQLIVYFTCQSIFSIGSMFSFDKFLFTDSSYQTDEQSVREALAKYGQVVDGWLLAIGIIIILYPTL